MESNWGNKMEISKSYLEDQTWALEHYRELQRKYADMWVAVHNKEVISADVDGSKVKKSVEKYKEKIPLIFVTGGADVFY